MHIFVFSFNKFLIQSYIFSLPVLSLEHHKKGLTFTHSLKELGSILIFYEGAVKNVKQKSPVSVNHPTQKSRKGRRVASFLTLKRLVDPKLKCLLQG